ncbi:MAG: RNA 2',3'-cyclic phosphodiesterase [Gemmatimonadaceae bacterium]|nr:RNA 2',3'-cyclic phosphodiesterase [Gemmatimonadaceae bacterium]
MRLFVAVTLPDDVRESIARATAELRSAAPRVRWVRPEVLHLTVKFLGERPHGDERRIGDALRPSLAQASGCDATIRGAGAFPNFRRPRVVWLGMHPLAPLAAIARHVDDSLLALGIARESRPFRAHVTLGRVAPHLATGDIETRAAPHAQHATHTPHAPHAPHAPHTTHTPHAQHAPHAPHTTHTTHTTHAPLANLATLATLAELQNEWSFPVRDVALVQSTLARGGPSYRVLDRFPLASHGAS